VREPSKEDSLVTRARTLLSIGISAVALAGVAYAAQSISSRDAAVEKFSADLLPAAKTRALALRPSQIAQAGLVTAAAAPTLEEVGDVDSFGRNVTWLGLTQGNVTLTHAGCATPAEPDLPCVELNAAPAFTSFALEDVARVVLPAKASNSLLCHWLSPVLTIAYQNPTAAPAVGKLFYTPTLTIENEVLNDPSLIDPTTGLPFGGSLRTSMTASERFEVPLAAGMALNSRERDSAVCIAGFITKRGLTDNFGLTEAQAKQFFKKKTTVRMNISGQAQYVDEASLILGLRIVGD
ncbi:MAG TPA: hypothetical protein VET30_01710, partial [Pseudoxanthomonas sp.]|nr:hypothetical protein [Pseudoxanthomonas sp.]